MKLSIGEHQITSQPMGSWPSFAAWCQCFVIWALVPAEGGESYPMKFFAKKQPGMALAGVIIALVMSYVTLSVLRSYAAFLNLMPDKPLDLAVASLALSNHCRHAVVASCLR